MTDSGQYKRLRGHAERLASAVTEWQAECERLKVQCARFEVRLAGAEAECKRLKARCERLKLRRERLRARSRIDVVKESYYDDGRYKRPQPCPFCGSRHRFANYVFTAQRMLLPVRAWYARLLLVASGRKPPLRRR